MKEFFIIMNPEKQGAKETAQVIRDYLTSHGASCLIGKGDGISVLITNRQDT